MKKLLSILTAAAVGGHGLFGCCWQPGHHAESHAPVVVMTNVPACCDDHRGVSHDRPSEKQHDHPAGPVHHHCAGGFTWIPSGKIQIENILVATPTYSIAILPALLDAAFCGHAGYLTDGPFEQAPPVRRHLLLQVLLT